MILSREITAAFCANDLLALGVLRAAVSTGRRVPGDIALLGYDDIDFAADAAVPLSSVRQPRRQIGRAAAQLLIEECDGLPIKHEVRLHARALGVNVVYAADERGFLSVEPYAHWPMLRPFAKRLPKESTS